MSNQRIRYIDRMKGFTIIFVVIDHLYLFCLHDGGANFFVKFIASWQMYLFMFISGFVAYIRPERRTTNTILYRTLLRRFVSYIFPAFVLSWLVIIFRSTILQEGFDTISFGKVVEGYWYLKLLAIFCFIQLLLYKLKKTYQQLFLIIFFYVLFFVGWKRMPMMSEIMSLEHATCFFPSFILGFYCKKYNWFEKLRTNNWLFSLSLVGYFILFSLNIPSYLVSNIVGRFLLPTFAIVTLSYLFMCREMEDSIVEKWLSWIGTKTLDVYIYHFILLREISFMDLSFLQVWNANTNNSWLCFCLIALLSIMTVYLSIWVGMIVRKSNFLDKIIYGKFIR